MALGGITLMMAGTALITLAGVGTPPVTAPVWVVTLNGGLTFGGWLLVANTLFLAGQLALLRRSFPPTGWLQIPVLALGSLSLDTWMHLLGPLHPEVYPEKLALLGVGIVVLAIGVAVEVAPHILYLPGEGIVAALSQVTGVPFARAKVLFDVTCVLVALGLSIALFGDVRGAREGTLLSALLVGWIVGWILPPLRRGLIRILG